MHTPARALLLVGVALTASVFAFAADTYTLRLNLQPGQSYTQRMTTSQEETQRVGNTLSKSGQTMTFDIRYDVQQVSAEGIATVKATYVRTASSLKSMGLETFYDSAAGDAPPKEFAVLGSFVGKGFTMELARDGSVRSVSGMTEMIDAMRKDLAMDEEGKEQFIKAMKSMASDESIRDMMEGNFAMFPSKPVAIGESWTRTLRASMMFPVEEENTWTLKSVEGNKATLEVTSLIRPAGEKTEVDLFGTMVDVKLEGTQSGTATLDLDTGWTLSSTIYQNVDGSMTPLGQSGAPSVPMHFKTTITLSLIE